MSSSSRLGSVLGNFALLGAFFAPAFALADETAPIPPPPGVDAPAAPATQATEPPAPSKPDTAAPVTPAEAPAAAPAPVAEPEELLSPPVGRQAPARVASVPAEATPLFEPTKSEPLKLQFNPGPTKDTPVTKTKDGENGLLGNFRIGPMVGAGFPGFMNAGANARIAKLIGFGVNYGNSPEVTVAGIGISAWNIEGYARVYPFKSPFFIGAGVGTQKISGKSSQSGATANGSVATTYIAPSVGFMWNWDFGLAIGFDVGVQIPVSNTRQYDATYAGIAVPDSELKELDDTLKKIGTTPIPVVNALRIGFLF